MQEGQEQPLNLLITLSPNSPSSHSHTLMAVCAMAMGVDAYQTCQTSRTTSSDTLSVAPCHDTSSRHGIVPLSSVNQVPK